MIGWEAVAYALACLAIAIAITIIAAPFMIGLAKRQEADR